MNRKLLFAAFLLIGISLLFGSINGSSKVLAGPGLGTAAETGFEGFYSDATFFILDILGESTATEDRDQRYDSLMEESIRSERENMRDINDCLNDPKFNGKSLCEVCYSPRDVQEDFCLDLDVPDDRLRYCKSLGGIKSVIPQIDGRVVF
jgi:hypothetical protein